jgi:dolichol-phosphate mannosyltransferase
VVVNSLVLFILVEAARLPHVLAATLSTESAILANFALNDRWTFRDVAPSVNWVARAARYNLVCLGGLLISVGVLAALTHWRHLHYLLANLAGVGAGLIWNYSGSSRLAWSRSPSRPPTRIAPSSPAPRSKASHRWPQSGDARGPKAEPIKEAVHP